MTLLRFMGANLLVPRNVHLRDAEGTETLREKGKGDIPLFLRRHPFR
jgi:hypothetical protein